MKLHVGDLQLYKKEIMAQVFPCEFYKNFNSIIFTEQLRWLLLKISRESFGELPGKYIWFTLSSFSSAR